VPTEYDPLLGKLIAWGSDRAEAIARMRRALEEYYVSGIQTNIALFRRILTEPDFVAARLHTRWLDEWLAARAAARAPEGAAEDAAILAAALWHLSSNGAPPREASAAPESRWKLEGRRELLDRAPKR
jgi:acetyl/propionyl-CoA carboxylase alpha subunit